MDRKDFYIWGLVISILVMYRMDITPGEALYLIQNTLPNYIKYKLI